MTKRAHRDSEQRVSYLLVPKALLQTGTDETLMHLPLHTQYIPQYKGACAQVSLKKKKILFYYFSETRSLTIERKKAGAYAQSFPAASHLHGSPPARATRKQDLPLSPRTVPTYAPQRAAPQWGSWAGGKGKLQHIAMYRHVLRLHGAEELHKSMFALQLSLVMRHFG